METKDVAWEFARHFLMAIATIIVLAMVKPFGEEISYFAICITLAIIIIMVVQVIRLFIAIKK